MRGSDKLLAYRFLRTLKDSLMTCGFLQRLRVGKIVPDRQKQLFPFEPRLSYFLFVTVRTSTLLALVRLDLLPFTLLTAGHQSSSLFLKSLNRQLGNHVLEFVGRLKHRDLPVRNWNHFAGARVPGLTSFAQLHLEGAESANLDVVSVLERLFHGVEKRVHDHRNVGPGEAGLLRHFFN